MRYTRHLLHCSRVAEGLFLLLIYNALIFSKDFDLILYNQQSKLLLHGKLSTTNISFKKLILTD